MATNEFKRSVVVGLFVLLCLVLIAGLLTSFSKGLSWTSKTYPLRLVTRNVAGIKQGASVLMAGVGVGRVQDLDLAPDGKSVIMHLEILNRYRVRADARFMVEQAGFLGDPYIGIVATENKGKELQPGDEIVGEDAFNLMEIARSASGLLTRVDQSVEKLNRAIARVDEMVLSPVTLTNLSAAIVNARHVTDRALDVMATVDALIKTNAPALTQAVSQFAGVSAELHEAAEGVRGLVESNRAPISATVSNVHSASARLASLMESVDAGQGLAGSLFKDDGLKRDVTAMANQLASASSNLNQNGLWRFLWKPKPEAR